MDAKKVFEILCAALDEREWVYEKEEEKGLVYFQVNGENMPLGFVILVDEERQLVRAVSQLPFKICEDKRMEAAIAVCVANYGMVDGSFDYDISNGVISFRLTASYRDSEVTTGMVQYMIQCSCVTVDNYNHRFMALDKGVIGIEEFIAKES